jgi:hypothetical protein
MTTLAAIIVISLALFVGPLFGRSAHGEGALPFFKGDGPCPSGYIDTGRWCAVSERPHATPDLRIVPPSEYDHPYHGGTLVTTKVRDQDEVRRLCPGAQFTMGVALACSYPIVGGCMVVVAPEADIKAFSMELNLVMRHEVAHCNGWPADHRDARSIEVDILCAAFCRD